jgi:hypothetical protein
MQVLDKDHCRGSSATEVRSAVKKPGVALFPALAFVVLVAAADITGNWEIEAIFEDSSVAGGGFDCVFKQQGEQLTGNCSGGTVSVTGDVKGQNVSWRVQGAANSDALTFTGTVDETGTGIKGHFTIAGKGGQFTAVKQKQ